ncbi:protein-glutamate O-methyltransferase CheR [Roseateles sp.]|uniref:CheR family methyltransferase n=1 Tax=Roseateles sp. TaxID=1971397 RepID=UPI0025FE5513|nr:protein-glutamate O-methyltransferase CheR [Roseateles sp.]MBV8035884.1 protein-glutamate O-methyltransferase CheR [Roseateles sp.]
MTVTISDKEFTRFRDFIFDAAGITLSDSKKALVSGRLSKRVAAHGCESFAAYLDLILGTQAPGELQVAVDLLTTNETYFFREPKHFDLLRKHAQHAVEVRRPLRVWSAACSSGEEVYSIAMVLDDIMGAQGWEVMGSDISTRMLRRARAGHYPLERTRQVPLDYLRRYCLRGFGDHEGSLLIQRPLRDRVQFCHLNLMESLPKAAGYDLIFLRNVMIYFNGDTKRQVVSRVLSVLKPGGHLLIGHSENLNGINDQVTAVAPSVYRKPGGQP